MRDFIQSQRSQTVQTAVFWTLGSFLAAVLAGVAFYQLPIAPLLITLSMAAVSTALLLPTLRHLATPKHQRGPFPLTNTGVLAICAACAVIALRPGGIALAVASLLLLAGMAALITALWRQHPEAEPAAPDTATRPTGRPNPRETRSRRRHSSPERRPRPFNAPKLP